MQVQTRLVLWPPLPDDDSSLQSLPSSKKPAVQLSHFGQWEEGFEEEEEEELLPGAVAPRVR